MKVGVVFGILATLVGCAAPQADDSNLDDDAHGGSPPRASRDAGVDGEARPLGSTTGRDGGIVESAPDSDAAVDARGELPPEGRPGGHVGTPADAGAATPARDAAAAPDFGPLNGKHKGLASWYRANSSQDSTNGTGWCGKRYTDATKGFAPPFAKMSPTLATWSSSPEQWKKDTAKWCGLEARVTNPQNGRSELLYIVDAFDPKWTRTEFAIDILLGPFTSLVRNPNNDKNVVVQDMEWELTGRRIDTW